MLNSIVRYTNFVRSAKVFLAALVILLTAIIFIYPIIKKNSSIRIEFANTEKQAQSTTPTEMANANFRGFDANNQKYNISAKTASQIDDNHVKLIQLKADIYEKTGKWLFMQSDTGMLQIKEKLLTLNGNIEFFSDDGYELTTQSMLVDIENKKATTNELVKGQGPLGKINSVGAVFDGKNKTAEFNSQVFVTIYLPEQEKK